ncbi:MAG: ABC transporter permease [Aeropyrum sp.]|nr:ABC transporter permease [Aeropyrum sp.]MCE4616658.1 ABC transporter permease [Aeropyrum sp.]
MINTLSRALEQAAVMTWAHFKRAWRMKYNMVNWAIIDALWLLIFIFAGLAFTPPEYYPRVVPILFFSMVLWSLMSTPIWAIGNWVRFYINIGLIDEHELAGASHVAFLATRSIPSTIISIISAIAVGTILYLATGVNPLRVGNIPLLLFSMVMVLSMATAYALIIAFAGMKLKVPAPMLDIMNIAFFFIGGVAVDVDNIPWPLTIVAVLTPYSHPAELMRYAVSGFPPYLGFAGEVLASIIFLALLAAIVAVVYRIAYTDYRSLGARGVGLT